jgi:hypothetical protein
MIFEKAFCAEALFTVPIKDGFMIKPGHIVFFLIFFLCLGRTGISAQTPAETGSLTEQRPVALMPFLGDDLAIGAQFQERVIGQVVSLEKYSPNSVSAEQYPQILSLQPDYPPDAAYLGGMRYAMTGEYYIDMDDLQHFQLWLWNGPNGALIYTDEMVFESMEEAEGYLPPMVSWIFSHIPEEIIISEETIYISGEGGDAAVGDGESEDSQGLFTGKLKLGLRGGGNYNLYGSHISAGSYEADQSQGFSGEGALIVEFTIFKLLGIQVEAVWTHDTFKAKKKTITATEDIYSTHQYKSMSLMFPLLIKVPVELGAFTLSPFGGAYFTMPLGKITLISNDTPPEGKTFNYTISPPLGLILGTELAFRLGPGELFGDLRFVRNIGVTTVERGQGIQYSQTRIGLSVGYKFLVWSRK